MSNKSLTVNDDTAEPWWGLSREVIPCFGARLVQEGNHLHFLADRAELMVPLATMTRFTWIRPSVDTQAAGADVYQHRTFSPSSALCHALSQWADLRSLYPW